MDISTHIGFSHPYQQGLTAARLPGASAPVSPLLGDVFCPAFPPEAGSLPQVQGKTQELKPPAVTFTPVVRSGPTFILEPVIDPAEVAASDKLEKSLAADLSRLSATRPVPDRRWEKGSGLHPGIELHNHMLGILDTGYFIHKAGEHSPRKLLGHIQSMFGDTPALQAEAPDLWRLLQKLEGKKQPLSEVRKTLERLLTATPCTPFDSVYTPRDELIQRHLEIPPAQISSLIDDLGLGRYGKEGLIDRFGGRHDRQAALKAIADAAPDDLRVRGGLDQEEASRLKQLLVNKRYEIFTEDTARALHEDNIHYSEQSISVNKLLKQLSPELMSRVATRLEREGIRSDIRYLAMINTSHMSESFLQQINPATGVPVVFEQKGLEISRVQYDKLTSTFSGEIGETTQAETIMRIANATPVQLERAGLSPEQARIVSSGLPPLLKRDLETLLSRGDIMGIDIAAPEKDSFTPRGMKNFDELYEVLKNAAKQRGRELVLRPHVGEGYPEKRDGVEEFQRYRARRQDDSKSPVHYDTAERNLEMLIEHLEARGYSPEKAREDGVVIRFGHATHATTQQIKRMKALGVVAEANLSSNVETGALQPVRRGDFFENHSLLNLLYQEVPTILNTDAHGVMHTTLQREYQQADRLIGLFRRNKLPIEIEGQQVYFHDLKDEEKARFDPARLRQWAEEYGEFVGQGDAKDRARTTPHV